MVAGAGSAAAGYGELRRGGDADREGEGNRDGENRELTSNVGA